MDDQEHRKEDQAHDPYDQDPAMPSLLSVLQILEHMQGGRRVNRRYARASWTGRDGTRTRIRNWNCCIIARMGGAATKRKR